MIERYWVHDVTFILSATTTGRDLASRPNYNPHGIRVWNQPEVTGERCRGYTENTRARPARGFRGFPVSMGLALRFPTYRVVAMGRCERL